MTTEDKILEQLAALTRSQEACVAEWRQTRDEAHIKSERVAAETEVRRAALEKKSKRLTVVAYVFGAAFILWFVTPVILSWVLLFWHPK